MSAQTKGQQIFGSEKVKKLIKDLSHEVYEYNKQITGVKPADPSLIDSNKAMMERVSVSRGRPLYHPYIGSSAGNGVYVELEDGSVKLDLINGIGIHVMGHSHPKLIEAAIKGALSDITMQGNLEPNKEYLQMTEKLVSLASRKSRLKYAWLSTCGTMANENALKMARQKNSPARMILAFKDAFAGRSTLMAEVTDNPAYKVGLPEYNEVLRLPFYDKKIDGPVTAAVTDKYLAILKEHYAKHEKNISCLVFEPMQGEGGYKAGTREFFVPLFEFCREKKIAIWADEVQTFTRTGEFFAYETLGIGEYIDLCTIAKTAQVGATLYTEEYNPKPGLIAGTFSGSSVALSVGLEILRILDEEGYVGPSGRIQKINKQFVGMLNELNETTCKGKLTDAGGLGLMMAVTPYDGNKDRTEALIKRLFQNGLIAFGCGKDPYRIRFLVPAIIQDSDIQVVKKIIEKSILEET
jgi:acetylornithine/N-succinyldiaminopimelate aminotransferase